MKDLLSGVEIALFIILPLLIYFQKHGLSVRSYVLFTFLIYLAWFLTYALFHELCHLAGTWITGTRVVDLQLMPRFWKGDFSTGYVVSEYATPAREFLVVILPYFRDLMFCAAGYLFMRKWEPAQIWAGGAVITFLIFSSLFDLFNNFFAYVTGNINDFEAMSRYLGDPLTRILGTLLVLIAMVTTGWVVLRKVPGRKAI